MGRLFRKWEEWGIRVFKRFTGSGGFFLRLCQGHERPFYKAALVSLLMIGMSSPVQAEAESEVQIMPSPHRPKVGLVLSGGGAKGLAHVGVLRVLEEMHVPVDVLVGTSAGSAVAALYAMGMPLDEIEDRFHEMDWSLGFTDEHSREERAFRRKQEDREMASFGLGLGLEGVKLRRGAVEGQELQLVLNDLTASASHVRDFDQLPLRYRAVAADLATGAPVAIGKGSLSRAIRASMSIPMVYSPVEIDGKLLVDGGVAANLPIDVARQLGAEVVIAIDISTQLSKKEELSNALLIADQITNLLTRRNVDVQLRSLTDQDVLIVPNLEGAGTADFDRSDELVELGATAARAAALELHPLAVSPQEWQAYEIRRTLKHPASQVLDRVEMVNHSHVSDEFILSRIQLKPGMMLDRKQLEKNIREIYGLGYFESVTYEVFPAQDGLALRIEAREKSWGPNYFRVGLGIEDNFQGDNFFNLAVGYNMTALNRLGAEWDTRAAIGNNPYLKTEFYQPLSFIWRYFVALEAGVEKDLINQYAGSQWVAEHDIRYSYGRLSLGKELGPSAEIRSFIESGQFNDSVERGSSQAEFAEEQAGRVGIKFRFDSQNQVDMPTEGTFMALVGESSLPEVGASRRFDRLAGTFSRALTFNEYTLHGRVAGSKLISGQGSVANYVRLGGFMRLSGYARDQFANQDAALGSFAIYRRFGRSLFSYYLGGAYEVGNVWDDLGDAKWSDTVDSLTAFVAFETPLGMLNLAYSHADSHNQSVYLSLGMGFQEIF
ncbi:MAG: patatin-like phospholipase family protein [Hahellaceae bacterium]|nr:patatin-like phospholipase family protein [Hahellaceae bacterium]MCP5168351.1 patatin-like phospholipase family protein [Hahellaceae bacterium]